MSTPKRWGDLRARVLSGLAMAAVALAALLHSSFAFSVLVVVCTGFLIWELLRMTAPNAPGAAVVLGLVGSGIVAAAGGYPMALALAPVLGLAVWKASERLRGVAGVYTIAILLACHWMVALRTLDLTLALWLLLVVIASDVMGYFVGRMLGGPKFWPAISPKKTWSGTVAGWVGAAIVGLVLMSHQRGEAALFSVLMGFAGQMGDIAESWIKRRAGVKDSSNLIPGHGGFLDRFDALIGGALVLGPAVALCGLFYLVKG